MQNRLKEIDFIRAAAALSVIAIHVTGSYIYSDRTAYLWNTAMRYAVPLFIILSGVVSFYSERPEKEFSCKAFWTKRCKKLIIPYIIWNIIYMLYSLRHNLPKLPSDAPGFLKELSHNIITGTGTYHLYFILIIVQLYLLYPLIRAAAIKYMKASLAISFLITLYCQTIIYLGDQGKATVPQTYIPFYTLFPVWIFFFVFGMYIADNIVYIREKLSCSTDAVFIIWLVGFVLLLVDTRLTRTQELSIKPSVMLYSVVSFILFFGASIKLMNKSNIFDRVVDFLSGQSFLVYLSHVLFLKLITSFSYTAGFGKLWESSRHQVSLYITTVVISYAFAYIMSYMPGTKYFGGVHKRYLTNLYHKIEKLGINV